MNLAAILLAAQAFASEQAPAPGLLYGELLEWDGTPAAGSLSIRDDENRVYRCSFDAKTYMELRQERVPVDRLDSGDRLEVLADRHPGGGKCYVRSIHVVPPVGVSPSGRRFQTRRRVLRSSVAPVGRSMLDTLFPRGNLTFSGVIVRMNDERVVLRTRDAGEQAILLRKDTRYSRSGLAVDSSDLAVNRRVFVRAGRNFENEIEAFHIVWGEILQPK